VVAKPRAQFEELTPNPHVSHTSGSPERDGESGREPWNRGPINQGGGAACSTSSSRTGGATEGGSRWGVKDLTVGFP
jgi:hypothetical protein